MAKNHPPLTAERLREVLFYDPETGVMSWKVSTAQKIKPGSVAGNVDREGYIRFKVCGRTYAGHRLAWLYVHGVWPTHQLDHINGIRADNRLSNLRESTNAENAQNRALYRNNTSGRHGVGRHKATGKWRARIMIDGRQRHLGTFDDIESAAAARQAAKADLHQFQPTDRGACNE